MMSVYQYTWPNIWASTKYHQDQGICKYQLFKVFWSTGQGNKCKLTK